MAADTNEEPDGVSLSYSARQRLFGSEGRRLIGMRGGERPTTPLLNLEEPEQSQRPSDTCRRQRPGSLSLSLSSGSRSNSRGNSPRGVSSPAGLGSGNWSGHALLNPSRCAPANGVANGDAPPHGCAHAGASTTSRPSAAGVPTSVPTPRPRLQVPTVGTLVNSLEVVDSRPAGTFYVAAPPFGIGQHRPTDRRPDYGAGICRDTPSDTPTAGLPSPLDTPSRAHEPDTLP